MITSHEVAKVFAIFDASYGHLWKQEDSAIEVWFKKLSKYTPQSLMKAAEAALKTHTDHPPTLSQFDALCYAMSEPDYAQLPAPPEKTLQQLLAQRAMLAVLFIAQGVEDHTLRQMIRLKNALVEEAHLCEGDFYFDVKRQLTELMEGHK